MTADGSCRKTKTNRHRFHSIFGAFCKDEKLLEKENSRISERKTGRTARRPLSPFRTYLFLFSPGGSGKNGLPVVFSVQFCIQNSVQDIQRHHSSRSSEYVNPEEFVYDKNICTHTRHQQDKYQHEYFNQSLFIRSRSSADSERISADRVQQQKSSRDADHSSGHISCCNRKIRRIFPPLLVR